MKKLLKRKIFFVPLIIVIALVVFAGGVYAATVVTEPGQVNVVAATNDIKVYLDSGCNFEITKIIWADLPVGGETTKTVYIKNIGNTDATVTAVLQDAPAGVNLKSDTNSIIVPAGQPATFNLVLDATQAAPIAPASFTVTFTSIPNFVNP
jgi:hypothetical protein